MSFWMINRMLEEQENGGVEEEEDDDPVFVLTDEWREFFAKSEAKRKQSKLFSPPSLPLSFSIFTICCLFMKFVLDVITGKM